VPSTYISLQRLGVSSRLSSLLNGFQALIKSVHLLFWLVCLVILVAFVLVFRDILTPLVSGITISIPVAVTLCMLIGFAVERYKDSSNYAAE
jgi:uncharacterized membrane protein (DUF485 family)